MATCFLSLSIVFAVGSAIRSSLEDSDDEFAEGSVDMIATETAAHFDRALTAIHRSNKKHKKAKKRSRRKHKKRNRELKHGKHHYDLNISTSAPLRINYLGGGHIARSAKKASGGPQAIAGFAEYLQHVNGFHGMFRLRLLHEPHTGPICEGCERIHDLSTPLEVSSRDVFVATDLRTTARKAAHYASAVNTTPVFFIQDSEHLFYNDAKHREDVLDIYMIPHLSIYNCAPLYNYFEIAKAVPSRSVSNAVYFQPRVPYAGDSGLGKMAPMSRGIFKVLIYGKNQRNVPGDALSGLKLAIQQGAFSNGTWEFYMVCKGGDLKSGQANLNPNLGVGYILRFLPWIPPSQWYSKLQEFSLAVVLMECASVPFTVFDFPVSGVLTVTNAYIGRDKDWFAGVSPLYEVARDHSVASVAQAVHQAASRLNSEMTYAKRQEMAVALRRQIPATWDQSFAKIEKELIIMFERASSGVSRTWLSFDNLTAPQIL